MHLKLIVGTEERLYNKQENQEMLFNHTIRDLEDWGKLFQNIDIFEPIAEYIFRQHNIAFSGIDKCTPGSNAVFRADKYIIKIFAPEESGIGGESDFITEQFGIRRANQLHIAAPKLYAAGAVYDKYVFRYLILEYIEGESLAEISNALSSAERIEIGRGLRDIVTKMDTSCEKFNSHVLFGKSAEDRWKVFSPKFQLERKEYLKNQGAAAAVYVHGDLNPDNIIIGKNNGIYIIDFADALTAPAELELAAVICDGFQFAPDYVKGFCGEYNKNVLVEKLLYGVLIHDYGVNIIRDNICDPNEIYSLEELRDRILLKI